MAELPRLNGIIKTTDEGMPAFIASASVGDIGSVQAAAAGPFDGVLFDMEHSPYDIRGLADSLQWLLDPRQIVQRGSVAPKVTPIVRIPPNRGGGDSNWSDDDVCQGQPVTGFRVQAGKYVDGIQFQYGGSRWGSVHGVGNHWSYEIAFQPGEYVVRVDYRSGSLMDAVGFVTNMGHGYGLFGGGGGTYAAFYPTPGQFLGCMSGRSGSSIDRMIFASTGPR